MLVIKYFLVVGSALTIVIYGFGMMAERSIPTPDSGLEQILHQLAGSSARRPPQHASRYPTQVVIDMTGGGRIPPGAQARAPR